MNSNRVILRRPAATVGPWSETIHPVLARVYAARQVASAAELDRSLDRLLPPGLLKGMDAAVALLAGMLREGKRILVIADFDADGATSCALVVRALTQMGARDVRYVVPNRFEYGYGLTPEIVALAAEQTPDLIITVDNGISSVEGVRAARDRGIRVLITDHHLPGAELPAADAIVNPNQPGDTFPSKNLAGVGVAFYLMLALRTHLRETGWFAQQNIPDDAKDGGGTPPGMEAVEPRREQRPRATPGAVAEPNLARLLDLVALGTVADVVPLDHNNRILVAQGLARINTGQCVAGVRALLRAAGRREGNIAATDLGFCVAPRLNAAGRLTDMALGIECLLTDDPDAAQAMAQQLDQLNRERRRIESGMQEQALAALGKLHLDGDLPHGLCLFDETWHQGVIGILASRIKDRVHRPVIAFAPANDTEIKGSARSVPGLHIRDALDAVAAQHPGLLSKFGGHAMAAGLSLPREHYETFRHAFADEVGRQLSADDLRGSLLSDGALTSADLSLELAELIRGAGPWGQGFPEPLFDGEFEIVDRRVVGAKHLKLTLRPTAGGQTLTAIAFGAAPQGTAPGWSHVRTAYRLDVNEYQGNRSLQLVIEYLAPV